MYRFRLLLGQLYKTQSHVKGEKVAYISRSS